MEDLNLLQFKDELLLKTENNKRFIRDVIRNKWLMLQPEELVRQLMIHYLLHEKNYNKNRIGIENGIQVNNQSRRYDLLVYNTNFQPSVLIECKAPYVKINEEAFYQAVWYNASLKVNYLVVTNGIQTMPFKVNYQTQQFDKVLSLPQEL